MDTDILTDAEIKEEPKDEEDEDGPSASSLLSSSVKKENNKDSKPGIIYLSSVPPKMNVLQIREYFSSFGPVGRSFLQPDKSKIKKRPGKEHPKNQVFTEGWIEFKKRRHAKKVAQMLNNKPVGGKKTKEYHDHLWNIKYLPGFHWVHLNERLAYERISRKAKLRTEISAAKREASFFQRNVEISQRIKKREKQERGLPEEKQNAQ